MNDSTSATSPVWPTRWPKDSFKGFWTWLLAGFLAFFFVYNAAAQLKQGIVLPQNPREFNALFLLQSAIEGALALLMLFALPLLSKFSLRELGFRAPSIANLGTAFLGAIAMVIVANGGATLLENLAHSRHQQDIVQVFRELHNPTTIAIFAGFAIVVAPFAEETFFRVFFFNLGLRYGGFWVGAVLSGVLFGIVHGDIYAALPLALGGMILCAVYYRSRNAFAPMITHALFNALSIVALLVAPQISQ